MKKNLTVASTVVLLSSSLLAPSFAKANSNNEVSKELLDFANEQQELYKESKDDFSVNYSSVWLDIAFRVADSAGDLLFNRQEATNRTSSSDSTSSGSISFNTSGYGSFATKEIEYQDSDHLMVAFAQTNPFGMFYRTIETMIQPLSGSGTPVQGSLTHNQQLDSEGGALGDYQAVWNQSSNQTWDLWVTYWHYGDSSSSSEDIGVAYDELGEEYHFVNTGESIELIPSDSHKNSSTLSANDEFLSLERLTNELIDDEQNKFVSQFKNYNVGDTIHFKDVINSVDYDQSLDATFFSFNDPHYDTETIKFPFAGDLTSSYSEGENLELKFEVVPLEDEYDFETIDYIKIAMEDSGNIPALDDFQN